MLTGLLVLFIVGDGRWSLDDRLANMGQGLWCWSAVGSSSVCSACTRAAMSSRTRRMR